MVLSGSAVYKERTKKAAELYKQGVAPLVIVTDDGERARWFDSGKTNPTIVELEQRELIANGVMPEAIRVLPGQVAGTDDKAKALRDEINARPLNSVLIVTSAYHTRRAIVTFEKILADRNVTLGIFTTAGRSHAGAKLLAAQAARLADRCGRICENRGLLGILLIWFAPIELRVPH